jgi:hypothetical protein
MRNRRRPDPFRRDPAVESLPPIEPSAVLAAFLMSQELADLSPADRELDWVKALLETIEKADWGWNDLDLAGLWAVLFDGLRWIIVRPPEDPERVARVLDAFFRFAGRHYGAPHAVMCSVYLRSGKAALDISRWVVPGQGATTGQ